MSLAEILLWQRLKGSPQGIAFRKQHPIGLYRADFYCAALKLVIEVDGAAHDMGDRPLRDERRTAELEQSGYKVLRVLASDVLRDPDAVTDSIVAFAKSSPGRGGGPAQPVEGGIHPRDLRHTPHHHRSAAVPLPAGGEEPDA
jgi:very-short-patch-repair endonuclease